MMEVTLREGERLDIFVREKLHIIQSSHYFAYSVDAVLLAEFARVPRRASARIIDFCSGNGAVALLLSAKTQAVIDTVELQAPLVEMAQRSVALNGLSEQIVVRQADLNELSRPDQLYDVVTCNPPYFSLDKQQTQHHLTSHAIARHEICLTLAQWVKKAALFLKEKGKLYCVYRPDRLDDLMEMLLSQGFGVHRIQFAYAKANQTAKVVLVEAIYQGGRAGVKIEPPIIIYNDDNTYTEQMRAIYYG